MEETANIYAAALEEWYARNARDLPWRNTTDAYRIWVSEIILQQTRVAQGMEYYLRFVERFPTVAHLAAAQEDEVLKYWQGLGYYSRARNMHAAARDIMERFHGEFPTTYDDIRSLKGVGDYTAAAIASIAYGLPHAVVDGNVYRVLARLYDTDLAIDTPAGKRHFNELAHALLHRSRAGIYNQAMMELGALVCLPTSPLCDECPIAVHCIAREAGTIAQRPVKQGRVAVKSRYFHYFVPTYEGDTWLHRREGDDIWRNLYEFPLIETDCAMEIAQLRHTDAYRLLWGDTALTHTAAPLPCKHVLTHRVIYATFYSVSPASLPTLPAGYKRVAWDEVDDYAVARLTEIYLKQREDS